MAEENASENYLGSWKDKDAAEAGLASMQGKMDEIGDEVGTLRQQSAKDAGIIETLQNQNVKPPETPVETSDLPKELQEVQTKMLKLDSADEDFTANMVDLMNQQSTLSAQIQHEKTLGVATKRFTEALSERDANQTTQEFKKENPEFDTPEMQAKIKEHIAADTTGMVDSLVAFREIQRDAVTEQVQGLTEENEKLKNLATLKQGTDETGNVYTGSGQTPAKTTKKTMTNAERDDAMMAAVVAAPE